MKQLFRITLLLIGFIWILAWAAAGRFDSAAAPAADGESSVSSGEPAAPGERDSADLLRVLIRGEVQEMDMGTYLLGVLRAEMPASFEEEALKAQAIAARTYTLYRIRGGGSANHPDAALIHEAAIGKIAGEQILKLRTLGLTEQEAEEKIIQGFLA